MRVRELIIWPNFLRRGSAAALAGERGRGFGGSGWRCVLRSVHQAGGALLLRCISVADPERESRCTVTDTDQDWMVLHGERLIARI